MIDRGRHNLLGIMINAVDYEAATSMIMHAAKDRRPFATSALAVHGVMTGYLDREHRYRLNRLQLVTPDGQPVRWALNWIHRVKLTDRVYGPNLTLEVCRKASEHGLPIFLYGSRDETLQSLSGNLVKKVPGLKIAGMRQSRFRQMSSDEKRAMIEEIRTSGARIVLVGLGCPRQEVWAYECAQELSMPVLAVGAAFDFHGGTRAQAPAALQKRGLEWLFRLCCEPRRLWRRYLILNPYYLWLVFCQMSGIRRFDPGEETAPSQELRFG